MKLRHQIFEGLFVLGLHIDTKLKKACIYKQFIISECQYYFVFSTAMLPYYFDKSSFCPYHIIEKTNVYKYHLEEFREGKEGSFLMCAGHRTTQNSVLNWSLVLQCSGSIESAIAVLWSISQSRLSENKREIHTAGPLGPAQGGSALRQTISPKHNTCNEEHTKQPSQLNKQKTTHVLPSWEGYLSQLNPPGPSPIMSRFTVWRHFPSPSKKPIRMEIFRVISNLSESK